MAGCNFLGYEQPQSQAMWLAFVILNRAAQSGFRTEKIDHLVSGDRVTPIVHLDDRPLASCPEANPDGPVGITMSYGINDEIR